MRVLFFWEEVGGLTLKHRCNPYAGLLARALEEFDVHLDLGKYDFGRDWLEAERSDHEVLHLNWLHGFYRTEDFESTVARLTRFTENLNFALSLGYRVVWTMHNLYPHEQFFPHVDRLGRIVVCSAADHVIAHCEFAAELARKEFHRRDRLHVIPHGNFIDVFPNEISKSKSREQLEIPEDAFVYLFFGNARAYKGIEFLIRAFCRVADQDALLALMMREATIDPEYAEKLRTLSGSDSRVQVFTSSFFENDEFQIYLNAADVAVFPFVEVLTSGSAITALSFGKPVILPKLGCLPELIDETMGILYDPKEEDGLERALGAIRERDLKLAGQAALERARNLDWHKIAGRVAEVYRNES